MHTKTKNKLSKIISLLNQIELNLDQRLEELISKLENVHYLTKFKNYF